MVFSLNKVTQSLNKIIQSPNKATQSLNKATQSLNNLSNSTTQQAYCSAEQRIWARYLAHSDRIFQVEHRLLPVSGSCPWSRREAERLVAGGEEDIKVGHQGVQVIIALGYEGEGDAEGGLPFSHGADVNGLDAAGVGGDLEASENSTSAQNQAPAAVH
jgi:hypothetical protein